MIRFSAINRTNSKDYNPYYQRHHLIPLQTASIPELTKLLEGVRSTGFRFDDFESNGILLPCDEVAAIASGRPLHRGPHPRCNQLVIERLFRIAKLSDQIDDASGKRRFLSFRIRSLQAGLYRGLSGSGFAKLMLNKRDPAHSHSNFSHLDDAVDKLFPTTKWPFQTGQNRELPRSCQSRIT